MLVKLFDANDLLNNVKSENMLLLDKVKTLEHVAVGLNENLTVELKSYYLYYVFGIICEDLDTTKEQRLGINCAFPTCV